MHIEKSLPDSDIYQMQKSVLKSFCDQATVAFVSIDTNRLIIWTPIRKSRSLGV